MKTLDTVSVGQKCKIINILGEHSSLRRRLLDMGLTPDTDIVISREAPLGDPIEVNLRGYSLTIRKDDAKLIEIEVE